jgi:hypothetical protein
VTLVSQVAEAQYSVQLVVSTTEAAQCATPCKHIRIGSVLLSAALLVQLISSTSINKCVHSLKVAINTAITAATAATVQVQVCQVLQCANKQ